MVVRGGTRTIVQQRGAPRARCPQLKRDPLGTYNVSEQSKNIHVLQRIARSHPFLILLAATVLVWTVFALAGRDYDDRGIGTVLFLLAYALGAPFLTLRRLLEPATTIAAPQLLTVVAAVLCAGLYVAADRLLVRFANRHGESRRAGA